MNYFSQQKTQRIHKDQGGFLLIEMLVAVFIFSIVMFISLGAVLTLIDANRKNQSTKSVINNLTLVVNSIAKNLAISSKYYCGDAAISYPGGPNDLTAFTGVEADCPAETPSNSITFLSTEDRNGNGEPDVVRYRFEVVDEETMVGRISKSVDSKVDFVPVTAPEVKISNLQFYISNTDPLIIYPDTSKEYVQSPSLQPNVVILIEGYAGRDEDTGTRFHIQTSVSQRSLNVIYVEN